MTGWGGGGAPLIGCLASSFTLTTPLSLPDLLVCLSRGLYMDIHIYFNNFSVSFVAYPIYPLSGEWVCNSGNIIYNVTLRGGLQSGDFKRIGMVGDMKFCMRYCCEDRKCDVAFMAKGNCYLVNCNNDFLCQAVPANSPELYPRIAYISRTYFNSYVRNVPNSVTSQGKEAYGMVSAKFGDVSEEHNVRPPKNSKLQPILGPKMTQFQRESLKSFDSAASKVLQNKLQTKPLSNLQQGKKNKISKVINALKRPPASPQETTIYSQGCYPTKLHKGVSLRYGTKSGDFYDYGDIGDMRMCVDLCCHDKACDVALMLGRTCYTISCYSFEMCQMVPTARGIKVTSQLAYVIKKETKDAIKKLKLSHDHEKNLQIHSSPKLKLQQDQQKSEVFSKDEDDEVEIGSPKSDIFSNDEPNVPRKFTKGCRKNQVLRNHGLVGGQKAGIYTLRGITPDFAACVGLCCAEMMCDAAFLLGRRCFSVQCYRNGACAGKPATSHGLRSKLAFVERKDQYDMSESKFLSFYSLS